MVHNHNGHILNIGQQLTELLFPGTVGVEQEHLETVRKGDTCHVSICFQGFVPAAPELDSIPKALKRGQNLFDKLLVDVLEGLSNNTSVRSDSPPKDSATLGNFSKSKASNCLGVKDEVTSLTPSVAASQKCRRLGGEAPSSTRSFLPRSMAFFIASRNSARAVSTLLACGTT